MNRIFGKVCRASVAAAGVLVATSAASAESRPLQFETEFDLGLDRVAEAAAAPVAVALDVAPPQAGWEAAIGSYLDGLLARAEANPATASVNSASAEAVASELLAALGLEAADEVVESAEAPVATTAAAKAEATPNPQLLAPVLSHPAVCELCNSAQHENEREAERAAAAAPAEVRIDDLAAWQKLADWAAARAADDVGVPQAEDQTLTAESDFFFDVDADEDPATE